MDPSFGEEFGLQVLDSLNANISVLNRAAVIVAVNSAWDRFARENGAPELAEHSVGLNYVQFAREAKGPWSEEAPEAAEGILAVLEGSSDGFSLEYPCHSPRQQRWFVMHVSPLDGSRAGAVVVHTDITARRKAEEAMRLSESRLRVIVQNMPVMLNAFNESSVLVFWNRECERVTGFRADDVIGNPRALEMLYPAPDRRRQVAEMFGPRPGSFRHRQIDLVCKNGQTRTISWSSLAEQFPIPGWHSWAVGVDVTAERRVRKDLRRSRQLLRDLTERLQSVREEERQDLSRRITAGVGHALAAAKLDVSWLHRRMEEGSEFERREELSGRIDGVVGTLDEAIQEVRQIASHLRPSALDDLGLSAALEWEVRQFEKRTDISCLFRASLDDSGLTAEQATAIYRVCKGLLSNVAEHAAACSAVVGLKERDGNAVLEVRDDGKGISPADVRSPKAIGILEMRERLRLLGGKLTIRGRKGKGTTVIARVPLREQTGTEE